MNKVQKQFCIIIAGATGVGKTDFSLALEKFMPIEIINGDVGQLYKPLSIGTAKPDWKNQLIPHHLFDSIDTPRSVTVVEFRKHVKKCMQEILERGAIPVIVGGSTFYVESLFFPPRVLDTIPHERRTTPHHNYVWQDLLKIDPERAAQIHPNDTYRITRALDLYNKGTLPSDQKPMYDPLSSYYYVYLTRDRDDLYDRINQRVTHMIDKGWIDEVRALINTPWHDFIMVKKFIGYPELLAFIAQENKKPLSEIVNLIAQKTRNYAKRQETYWRRLEKKLDNCLVNTREYTKYRGSILHCNLTQSDPEVCCKKLAKLISESESDVP